MVQARLEKSSDFHDYFLSSKMLVSMIKCYCLNSLLNCSHTFTISNK